jgi:hypothetical protein
MTEYRIIDPVAEDNARAQRYDDEQFKLSQAYAHPNHRDAAREYLRSPSPDPVLRSQAIIDAYSPDAPQAGLSAESEATLRAWEAQSSSSANREPPPEDPAIAELRRQHLENLDRGYEDGWRDPNTYRFPTQGGPR